MARWSVLKKGMHKFVGTRSSPGLYASFDQFPKDPSSNFGKIFPDDPSSFLSEIASNRLVFVGEIHSQPPIVTLQRSLQEAMSADASLLHVVLEHFSFEMQPLLTAYQSGEMDFDRLTSRYREVGAENHDLGPYRPLLESARDRGDAIRLHAGFLPRSCARLLMREGEAAALASASAWLPPGADLEGHGFHYDVFESLISGRDPYREEGGPPDERFRGIFRAQVLKDVAMAHKIGTLLENAGAREKILVVAGNGHVLHHCGVPERVLRARPGLAGETALVASQPSAADFADDAAVRREIEVYFGPPGTNPADYVYFYREWDRPEEDDAAAKAETRAAYDKVGESAHQQGSLKKARAIMNSLGYTQEQFDVAGPDAYNFQGVGNPHLHANVRSGEAVLDLGSGLGVDTFIAYDRAGNGPRGKDGRVIGIDLSEKEVEHATRRAEARGLDVRFAVADMEDLPLPDDMFDVVISNGAFCLAPNKKKAFAEILRVLKPGGRMSVCTSTVRSEGLEAGVDWPLCMRMFVKQEDILPMCKELGFRDVEVDDSDSLMTFELPEEAREETNPERSKIHVGSEAFRHLENYDMNKICARVCVVGKKPS